MKLKKHLTLGGLIVLLGVVILAIYHQHQAPFKVNSGGNTMQNKSTINHHVTVSFNGQNFSATLNDSPVSQDILKQLPFTASFKTYVNDKEKITDLDFKPHLGNYDYDEVGKKGRIAYWQPDNRIVIYYGDVGAYPGIKVIGSFDDLKAVSFFQQSPDNTEVTFKN